jgi:hypothetical protein
VKWQHAAKLRGVSPESVNGIFAFSSMRKVVEAAYGNKVNSQRRACLEIRIS